MSHSCSKTRGFTLIELLVVITIIGILAGLSVPAVTKSIDTAKRAEAGAMVNQLRTALSSYETEYGVYPTALRGGSDTTVKGSDIYHTLIAKDGGTNSGHVDNPRRIIFMEFNAKTLRSGSTSSSNKTPPTDPSSADNFVDPWSQDYSLTADSNYDNVVALPSPFSGNVNAKLIVWCPGNQKSTNFNGGGSADRTKYVASWK